jgi:hypothetical protein
MWQPLKAELARNADVLGDVIIASACAVVACGACLLIWAMAAAVLNTPGAA